MKHIKVIALLLLLQNIGYIIAFGNNSSSSPNYDNISEYVVPNSNDHLNVGTLAKKGTEALVSAYSTKNDLTKKAYLAAFNPNDKFNPFLYQTPTNMEYYSMCQFYDNNWILLGDDKNNYLFYEIDLGDNLNFIKELKTVKITTLGKVADIDQGKVLVLADYGNSQHFLSCLSTYNVCQISDRSLPNDIVTKKNPNSEGELYLIITIMLIFIWKY